ncbi:Rcs stress response system protein RcsF [Thalassotalea fonticola]|uniref:Rcs stress response system protein RcsF n=1 Tax=Thalassotalea fonticola TaxID=3065649 RepID=A0ABZ0GQK8_9GAMM|nr:Rcs stress response system protein RcsF [Colwelliaceae bacterium S1-1]
MKITKVKKLINLLTISSVSFLFACANGPSVETNLDKENFEEYFAAGNVTVYQNEDDLPGKVISLGLVEGESCKAKENDAPANAADARTMAREKSASMDANAVIFTSCTLIEDQQCLEMMVCYGKAFQVSSN